MSLYSDEKRTELVRYSGFFDSAWYLANAPELAATGMDPVDHYIRYGWLLGLDPGPNFSNVKYLETHRDIEVAPLVHYLTEGLAGSGRTVGDASETGLWRDPSSTPTADDFDGAGFPADGPRRLIAKSGFGNPPETTDKPRIAYVLWAFPVLSETFVLNEIRRLVETGYDVRVFTQKPGDESVQLDFAVEWEVVEDSAALATRLTETGRTVVHSHFVYPVVTLLSWPACENAGVEFTFIAHAVDIFHHLNDGRNRIREISESPKCRKVFVPSEFHRKYLIARGVAPAKLCVNPNGVDPSHYPYRPRGDAARSMSVCAIHRFTEKKGLEQLIRSAKLLAGVGISIHIYGFGELEQAYRDLVQAEGISNVTIEGPLRTRDELLATINSHDAFLCPSVQAANGDIDGVPTVLMDAMAVGSPVIATDISGIGELVSDRFTGLICEPTPVGIASAITALYNMDNSERAAMVDNARQRIEDRFNTQRLVRTLVDVWSDERFDVIIVSWNNLSELREVVARVLGYTDVPFNLIIVDNASDPATTEFLLELYAAQDNVTLQLNPTNEMVGPATNDALEYSESEFAFYLCSKEAYVLGRGWHRAALELMRNQPRVGIAGTIGHSPSYLFGAQFPTGIPDFGLFRNQEFAMANPHREIGHVQGGLFVIRRTMVDEIGGLSNEIVHNYTDVELSYYAQSEGWELGQVPDFVALYKTTQPGLGARLTETTAAVHPPTLSQLPAVDGVVRGTEQLCGVCDWHGSSFDADRRCPQCRSRGSERALIAALAETTLWGRQLPALSVEVGALAANFTQQFPGPQLSAAELQQQLERGHLEAPDAGFDVALICARPVDARLEVFFGEVQRILSASGHLLVRYFDANNDDQLVQQASEFGFERVGVFDKQSTAANYEGSKYLHLAVSEQ